MKVDMLIIAAALMAGCAIALIVLLSLAAETRECPGRQSIEVRELHKTIVRA